MSTEIHNWSSSFLRVRVVSAGASVDYTVAPSSVGRLWHEAGTVTVVKDAGTFVGEQAPSWLYSTRWLVGENGVLVQTLPDPTAYPFMVLGSPIFQSSLVIVALVVFWKVFKRRFR